MTGGECRHYFPLLFRLSFLFHPSSGFLPCVGDWHLFYLDLFLERQLRITPPFFPRLSKPFPTLLPSPQHSAYSLFLLLRPHCWVYICLLSDHILFFFA